MLINNLYKLIHKIKPQVLQTLIYYKYLKFEYQMNL